MADQGDLREALAAIKLWKDTVNAPDTENHGERYSRVLTGDELADAVLALLSDRAAEDERAMWRKDQAMQRAAHRTELAEAERDEARAALHSLVEGLEAGGMGLRQPRLHYERAHGSRDDEQPVVHRRPPLAPGLRHLRGGFCCPRSGEAVSDRLSYEEVVERLVVATGQLAEARVQLHALGSREGDRSLSSQVAVWRHAAEVNRLRQEAAELALRALRGHWVEAPMEIDAWKRATNQPTRRTA